MSRAVMAMIALSVLAGCAAVGPDYERPAVGAPEQFRGQSAGAQDPNSLADLAWWELFQDPALRQLIRDALEHNKDLRFAVARVSEARAVLGVTRSEQLPQLNLGGTAGAERVSEALGGPGGDQRLFRAGLDLSFELDIWGRLRRSTEAARARLLSSDEVRLTVVTTLVSDVARTYFELRELDLELDIARRTVASRQDSLRLVRALGQGGMASRLEVRQAEAELARTSALIPDLERQITQKENALSILLGRNPGDVTRGQALGEQTVPPEVPAGLPSALLERRPDIRAAEQLLVAANADIGVARAAFFPKISLTGALGVASTAAATLFTGGALAWTFLPNLDLPIFDAGRRQGNLEAAQAREQQALITYEGAIQQAFREVADALIAHQKTREVRADQERFVSAAQDAVGLATRLYRGGMSSYLEVLDAQRQLLTAETGLAQTNLAQLVAVVQLYKALGGGWQPERTGAVR